MPQGITVTAQYALALFGGKNVTSKPPKTEIWCLLYAQVRQADGKQNRNILLAESRLSYVEPTRNLDVGEFLATRSEQPIKVANSIKVNVDATATGRARWSEKQISQLLAQFDLAGDTGLSVLAVEMMPRYDRFILYGRTPDETIRPLSRELGQYRILRTSRLVAAPEICCDDCA